jgi:GAF domain-containing protein
MNADRCVLHLIDPGDRTMLYEAASYSADGTDDAHENRYNIHAHSIIAGLLHSGEALTLEEQARTRRRDTRDVLKHLGFRSALLLALKNRDRTVGFLGVGFTSRDHRFSRIELNLAQTLASQVAAAIVNAQLYVVEQQRAEELTKLQQMNTQLGTNLDLEETLAAIYDGVRSLVPFTGLQITLYNAADQTLNLAVAQGLSNVLKQYNLSDGLCGWVARYRKPLRISGAQHPPARPQVTHFADGSPVRSYLGLPLLTGDQLIGTLELFSHQPQQFSSVDEHLLMIAAGSAARALLNVQRYEQADEHLHSRLKQLTALQHVSRQLATTLSLDVILGFALEEALRATPATQGYIALRRGGDDDLKIEDAKTAQVRGYIALRAADHTRQFEVLAAGGYGTEEMEALVRSVIGHGQTVAERALHSSEAELVDELTTDDRINGVGPQAASALAMPVFYEDHIVGVLNLHSPTPHAFNHDSLEFARALTDQVALAIGNAQRYDDQRRQRELLLKRANMLNEVFGIGQALRADRSLEEVLEQIAFSVVDTADFRSIAFCLPSADDPSEFSVITGAGMPLSDLERMRRAPLSLDLLHRFFDADFQLGRSFFVPAQAVQLIARETSTEPIRLFVPVEAGTESQFDDLLFVPLYSTRAHLVGVMIVNVPEDRPQPTRRAVEPLEIFGDQAAIAIENANLLLEARAQTEQMTALYHVGTAATSTLDLDELLEGVYNEIVDYLGVPSFFFVSSYDRQTEMLHFELFKEEDHLHPVRH